jgi:hypothetical protein
MGGEFEDAAISGQKDGGDSWQGKENGGEIGRRPFTPKWFHFEYWHSKGVWF